MTWSTVSIVQKSVSLLFILGILGGFYFYSKQVPGAPQSSQWSMNNEIKLIEAVNRPPFSLPGQADISKYYVHIWSITCEPCLEENPWIAAWTKSKAPQGVKDVWVHVAENDAETSQAKKYLSEQNFGKEVVFITRKDLGNINIAGYPTHYLIDAQSRVAFEWTGRLEKVADQFSKLWLQVQSESQGPSQSH